MENTRNQTRRNRCGRRDFSSRHQSPKLAGLIIILIGLAYLFRNIPQTSVILPDWLFSWPVLLIVVGIYNLAKHRFQNLFSWIIPIGIGIYFLIKDYFFLSAGLENFTIPIILIAIGFIFIFKPKNHRRCYYPNQQNFPSSTSEPIDQSSEDFVNINSTFGNIERNILSKKFKGGNIICSFGGAEIDLSQADMEEKAIINISITAGGAKIAVPSNWNIQNDVNVILGGIEDKRKKFNNLGESDKVLILEGSVTLGGLEITN